MRTSVLKRIGLCLALAAMVWLPHTEAGAATRYAAATGNWSVTSTWNSTGCGNATNNPSVPGAADDVIICPSRTVILNGNRSAQTITINNTGILRLGNSTAARTLTVSGDINVNGGGTFDTDPAFAATHVLAHAGAGNIINDGLINFANTGGGNNAVCNVTFSGWTGTRTVSGAGTSGFNRITINGNSNTINDIVDFTAANFSMAAIGGNGIVLTDGTFRLSTPANIAPFGAAAFTLAANDRFWLNDPGAVVDFPNASTFTVNAGELRIDSGTFNATGNVANVMNITSGALRVNGGTLNIGSAIDNTLRLTSNANSTIQMTGGTINVAGRLASSATGGAGVFNLSGGTITTGIVGNTTNNALNAPFFIGSGVSYTQSGGTIEIQNANALANAREYDVRSTTSSVTGGTLKIGNESTIAGQTFQINAVPPLWNLAVVNNTALASDPTAILISALTIGNDVSIGDQTTLNANNLNISIGGNWTTDGTFTPGTGTVTFAGSVQQTLSGAAASTTFYRTVLNNASGLLLTATSPTHDMSVSNLLTLTSGRITTGANKVSITNGSAITGAGATAFVLGNLGKTFATGAGVSRTFEVGSETPVGYAPILVTFASVTTAGEVVGSTTGMPHPYFDDSGLDDTNTANRYWTLTNNGVGSASTYNATFSFLATDLTVGATPTSFIVQRYAPAYPALGTWALTTTGTVTATSTQALTLALSEFGDFVVGVAAAVIPGLGRFNMFEPDTPPGDVTGLIKTKIAGTTGYAESTINLDIVAIRNNGNLRTNYSGTVTVDLYDASVSTGTIDRGGCDSGWTYIQTLDNNFRFFNSDNGRKAFTPFAVAEAYPNVRLRIYQNNNVYGCSTDAFAIRPYQFSNFSVTDNDWQTAGTGRFLNSAAFGAVTHKAGRPFTIRADAINRAGNVTANYVGIPNGLVTPCASGAACTPGIPVGVSVNVGTNFAAGQLTSNNATYGEVGAFSLQLSDVSFAAIDAIGTLPSERDIVSAVVDVGRFVPDHFSAAPSTPEFGTSCGAGGFTYLGQSFSYTTVPVITLQAEAYGSNAVTTLYTGSWWRVTNGSLTGKTYTTASGSVDTSGITGTDPVINDAGGGSGSLTFSSGTGLFFTRTTPVAPFNAEISLAINVIDADGVVAVGNPVSFGAATAGNGIAFSSGKPMRFGRLRIGSASGSQLLPLALQMQAQYWGSTNPPANTQYGFITNTEDSCTALAADNIAMGNYQRNLNACETSISVDGFSGGRSAVRLTAPGSGNNGSVDLSVNLGAGSGTTCIAGTPTPVTGANRAYLQGNWSGGAYDQNPGLRASFGLYRGSDEVIYTRENY